MNPNHIFVYGTLKKEHSANNIIQKISHYVDKAKIHGIMYDLGRYPGILEDPKSYVYGEVYAMENKDALQSTDKYEGFDPKDLENSLFIRKITTAFCDDESQIPVFAYFYNYDVKYSQKIPSGIWNKK